MHVVFDEILKFIHNWEVHKQSKLKLCPSNRQADEQNVANVLRAKLQLDLCSPR